MSGQSIEPVELLEVADMLAPGESAPSHAAHRRAVSTAYYAVYHAIAERVARAAFTEADTPFVRRVRRWIRHGDIRAVAVWVSQLEGRTEGRPPRHIAALLRPAPGITHIDRGTLEIAEGFLELSELRERADYDHEAVFTRLDTIDHLRLARSVVATVEGTQTDAVERFFGLVAMRSTIQSR